MWRFQWRIFICKKDFPEVRNTLLPAVTKCENLDQSLNSMLSMPFFLFIMISLSSILTMNTLKRSNNLSFIVVGLITCIIVYYFKDLSLALGQTNRIPLSLSAWIPIITIGLFSSVGVLQINEK